MSFKSDTIQCNIEMSGWSSFRSGFRFSKQTICCFITRWFRVAYNHRVFIIQTSSCSPWDGVGVGCIILPKVIHAMNQKIWISDILRMHPKVGFLNVPLIKGWPKKSMGLFPAGTFNLTKVPVFLLFIEKIVMTQIFTIFFHLFWPILNKLIEICWKFLI